MSNSIPGTRMHLNIPPIPPPMLQAMEQNRTYIFNVGPVEHMRSMGTMGRFVIPACSEGEKVAGPVSYQGKAGIPGIVPETVVKAVEGRKVEYGWDFNTTGHALARDIIGTAAFHDASDNLTQYGVFIAAGEEPTEEEMEAARAKLHAHYEKLVRFADEAYELNGATELGENGKSYSSITQDHVKAAKILGLERPWVRKNVKMVPCDGCGKPVLPTAVRCPNVDCGAILNEERARKLFPHLYAHELQDEPRRTTGRSRKEEAA